MKQSLATFIAWRYLTHKNKDSSISFMIKICFLGIAIGTFALMLTLIITNGFEKVIHEKMRGINADVTIASPGNRLDYNDIKKALTKEFAPLIHGISGHSIKQVIIDRANTQTVLFLKGIDTQSESSVSCISEKIVRPLSVKRGMEKSAILPTLLQKDSIIIGYKTAHELGLSVGQNITVLIPWPVSKKRLALSKHTFCVAGIFNVGLEEYDSNIAFIDLDCLNDIFDEKGVDAVVVSLNQTIISATQEPTSVGGQIKKYIQNLGNKILSLYASQDPLSVGVTLLKKRLPHLVVVSWKEQYPALVSSLKLEKYVMFLVIALITLVACMNMISLLFMQIQQKRHDIAIFRAMGLATKHIHDIFIRMGLVITTAASLCGLAAATTVGYWIEKHPVIELPDVYYVSHLPARVDLDICVIVFFVTVFLGFIATWIPARRTKYINIVDVLRQE